MIAQVAELVYAYASEAYPARVGGSNPLLGTKRNAERRFLICAQKAMCEAHCVRVRRPERDGARRGRVNFQQKIMRGREAKPYLSAHIENSSKEV